MSTKTVSIIASVVTALLVLLIVAVFAFGGIVLLNGFMDASAAIYAGFTCLGLTLILCPILAGMLTRTLISKFSWNNVLAGSIAVLTSTLLGAALGFGSVVVMGIVADIMWRS